jgi:hypothetical protein
MMAKLKRIGLRRVAVALLGVTSLFGFTLLMMMANPPGSIFELDGNTTTQAGCDWNQLNGTTGKNGNTTGPCSNVAVKSFAQGDDNVFTTGGSKDPLDSTSWKWKAGTTPDKDSLTNAYAAEVLNGHEFFTFGAELFASNGDANIGLWFFQQNVTNLNDGSFGPGKHQNKDIFVVSAFTNGGKQATVTVYLWDSLCTAAGKASSGSAAGCVEANLRQRFQSNLLSTCNTADDACAVSNNGPITVSWPYATKFGGPANSVPATAFFEGGIDVTDLLSNGVPGNEPCFSSFIMDTRSSQTPSSTLKDFIGGQFNTCGNITVDKTCECDKLVNNTTQYEYVVSGNVYVTQPGQPSNNFYNVTVTDNTAAGTTITCHIGTIAANSGPVAWGPGKFDCGLSTFNSASKGPANTVTVSGNRGSPTGTLIQNSYTVDACGTSACPITPGYTLTKVCDSADPVVYNGLVAIQVSFHGTVTNNGNVALNGINVCDDENATSFSQCDASLLTSLSLSPGGHQDYNGTYIAQNFTTISPGRAKFSDVAHASGGSSALGGNVTPPPDAPASCLLCPPGSAACPAIP